MYESPFTVIYGEPIYKQLNDEFENAVMECVASCNISVDKDELIKALQYDRDQYQKGYNDGVNAREDVYKSGFAAGIEYAKCHDV